MAMTTMPDHPLLTRHTLATLPEWRSAAQTTGGVVLIDKESSWTSFDCVARLRSLLKTKKIGHAGTLDPLATGLLVICAGKATKDIQSFQDDEKEYVTTIRLGAVTDTDDGGAPERDVRPVDHLATADVVTALQAFTGSIEQIPPAFSAIRHQGRRQYDLARRGEAFEARPRQVTIHELDVVDVTLPNVTVRIRCSKGTYIRSIARDLGTALGCGGYAASLRRTRIGSFAVDDALTIGDIQEHLRTITP